MTHKMIYILWRDEQFDFIASQFRAISIAARQRGNTFTLVQWP